MTEYDEYIGHFQRRSLHIDPETIRKYTDMYSAENNLSMSGLMVPYLLNLSTLKYVYMCQSAVNILGIPASRFLEAGIKTLYAHIHPDDISILHHNIFPKFRKIKLERPVSHTNKLSCEFNYRFNHPNKKYIQCLEKVRILETDQAGNPALIFGLITDISEYKKDNSIIASVSILNKANEYETIYAENYNGANQHLFTKQEMYVIRLLAEGLSSKDIGSKLFISSKTVDKHRRNILHKYSKKNTRELIHYARQQGWV